MSSSKKWGVASTNLGHGLIPYVQPEVPASAPSPPPPPPPPPGLAPPPPPPDKAMVFKRKRRDANTEPSSSVKKFSKEDFLTDLKQKMSERKQKAHNTFRDLEEKLKRPEPLPDPKPPHWVGKKPLKSMSERTQAWRDREKMEEEARKSPTPVVPSGSTWKRPMNPNAVEEENKSTGKGEASDRLPSSKPPSPKPPSPKSPSPSPAPHKPVAPSAMKIAFEQKVAALKAAKEAAGDDATALQAVKETARKAAAALKAAKEAAGKDAEALKAAKEAEAAAIEAAVAAKEAAARNQEPKAIPQSLLLPPPIPEIKVIPPLPKPEVKAPVIVERRSGDNEQDRITRGLVHFCRLSGIIFLFIGLLRLESYGWQTSFGHSTNALLG